MRERGAASPEHAPRVLSWQVYCAVHGHSDSAAGKALLTAFVEKLQRQTMAKVRETICLPRDPSASRLLPFPHPPPAPAWLPG